MQLIEQELRDLKVPDSYTPMVDNINKNYPSIMRAIGNFCKTQTQFMDNMMSVHPPTPIRSLHQILAEIEHIRMALDEAYFKMKKGAVELKKKEKLLSSEMDPLDRELLEIEIEEMKSGMITSRGYIEGAIRKLNAYINQYNNILKSTGKTELTEEDVERDEARYHVMKAFEQALCAARSHNGFIDEGNYIYLYQIGISGTAAQAEVTNFLNEEVRYVHATGELPSHENTLKFLKDMGDKYSGCAEEYATRRGMKLLDETSLHR